MSNPRKCAICGAEAMVLMFHICLPGTRREPPRDTPTAPSERGLDKDGMVEPGKSPMARKERHG